MVMVIQVTKNFCFYVNRQLLFFGFAAGLLGVISYADEQSINIKVNYIVV
jgi:hypothetical protein